MRVRPAAGWRLSAGVVFGVVALALLLTGALAALTFPALSGRVVDEAGILDAASRAAIERKSADLEAKTTDQLVVATLKSLQGTSIEDYANQLFRQWRIGQREKNNGVLLVVAPTERKVRIEVGYGLEGTLTDAVSRLIIENSILPRFRAGDFPGGIARGVDDIIQVLTGDAAEWQQRAATRPDNRHRSISIAVMFLVFGVICWIVYAVARAASNVAESTATGGRGRKGRRRRGRAAASEPWYSGWSSSDSGSGWSSSDSGGFSGGGGDSGGGGASGSW